MSHPEKVLKGARRSTVLVTSNLSAYIVRNPSKFVIRVNFQYDHQNFDSVPYRMFNTCICFFLLTARHFALDLEDCRENKLVNEVLL